MMVSIGFYISKDSLSLAELSFSSQKPEILSVKSFFFKNSQSEEEKQALLSKEAERIENQYKGKSIRLCYGLSQSAVSSFFVEFPFKEKFKILKTLPFEIEDKTPFQLDKSLFDARICRTRDGNKSAVLVFVTPEENVKEFVNFTKPLKRNIHLLSCSSSALANLLENWNVPLSQAQNLNSGEAYIYLGLENSLVLLYKDGFLNHVSVLEWGCRGIIEEMAKAYKLSMAKAYDEFFAKAFILTQVKGFTKEQKFFSNLIKKQIQFLIPELKLLKMSLEIKQNQTFSKAVVFGQGAMIKNLSAVLTEELDLPVSKLKSFAPFPNFDLQEQPLADMALGLALEGLKKSPYTGLNFLQSTKKTALSLYPKKWKKTALVFIFCFVVFSVYAFVRQFESSAVLSKMEEVFSDYGKKIAYLRESAIHVESIEDFLAMEKEKKEDEEIVREQLNLEQPMDRLEQIVQKIGSAEDWGLSLHYLKISGQKVEMRGAINSSALERFKALLQSLSKKPIENIEESLSSQPKEKSDKAEPAPSAQPQEKTESSEKKDSKTSDSDVKKQTKELAPNVSSFSYSLILKKEL
ncbi:MAG: hypothetical protein OXJ52_02700 [Oligoflexia bacterium]|nr:hypothetical protein [Oligoflexia bacterium]